MFRREFTANLKDGTEVFIRLICPEDKGEIEKGFMRLSFHSRRNRFVVPMKELLPSQLKYLTEIDNTNHLAYGVMDISLEESPGIGVARYIRNPEEPESAEIAVTVIDDYQRLGLGSILIKALLDAAHCNGILKLYGFIIQDNVSMIKLMRKYGASIIRDSGYLLKATLVVEETLSVPIV